MNESRRNFLKTASVAGALSFTAGSVFAEAPEKPSKILLGQGDVILFQGDSITDAGRRREGQTANNAGGLGNGYAYLAAAALLNKYPQKNLQIHNRGISGNKVYQLAERWDKDCLDLKPTVLSILIGVNDYWHAHDKKYDGTAKTYRDDFARLLDRTKAALPDVKLILGEPFAVKGVRAVDDTWYPDFDGFRAAAADLAKQYDAVWIPYQKIYDDAQKKAPANYWTGDGVHASIAGNELMAQAWLDCVKG